MRVEFVKNIRMDTLGFVLFGGQQCHWLAHFLVHAQNEPQKMRHE